MMKFFSVLVSLNFLFAMYCHGADSNLCSKIHANLVEHSFNLSFEEFDQTPQAGWRILESSECYLEASHLIKSYGLRNGFNSSLLWHQFQMTAMAGNYAEAISLSNSILQSDEGVVTKSPFLWNEYVAGTVAFLKRDRRGLLINRNNLALQSDFKPNALNLAVLDRLYENFDSTYLDAYTGRSVSTD